MPRLLLLIGAAVLFPESAHASPCTDSFWKRGNVLTGQQFSSRVAVPGLNAESALRQLRIVLPRAGMRLIGEDQARGVISAELPATMLEPKRRVDAYFTEGPGTGFVQMVYGVKAGFDVGAGNTRQHLCGLLAQVSGATVTRQPARVVPAPVQSPIGIESTQLVRQVRDVKDNPALVRSRFGGRLYRVSGMVTRISESAHGYSVIFEGEQFEGNGAAHVAVMCNVTRANAGAAESVYPNQRGSLIGRFAEFDNNTIVPAIFLDDCRVP
jgi:hypothetical protein